MATFTFNAMRERVFTVVRDTARTFVTEQDVDQWMREAMRDLSARLHINHASASGTVTSGNVDLPVDYVDLVSLAVDGVTDGYVDFDVDPETFNLYVNQGSDPGVTIGRVFNRAIELYPEPANGTAYTLRYWNSVDDSLSNFNPAIQTRIVNYARAHALYKEKDFGAGDRYLSMYEDGLPGPNDLGPNHDPGPWSIRPEPNYFESDPSYVD